MKKQYYIGIVILAIVLGGGAFALSRNSAGDSVSSKQMQATMSSDTTDLKNLTGDDFDAAFIKEMTEHHAGAIAMAELVDTEAKHPELQALGKAIIVAQTKEIADMKAYAQQFGYDYQAPSQAKIDDMKKNLVGKTGDDLDRQFITEMIGHHEGALAMTQYVSTNAKHQEIKTLAAQISTDQTREIAQMREWATMWGYEITKTSGGHNAHGL